MTPNDRRGHGCRDEWPSAREARIDDTVKGIGGTLFFLFCYSGLVLYLYAFGRTIYLVSKHAAP